jgi:hypothetical protein
MSKILILSDLHMHGGNPMSPQARSYLSSDDQFGAPEHNPLSGIETVLKSENLSIDWLVCAGDVADQGNRDALRKGWMALTTLKSRLRARLISTVGNHDLDSRRAEPNEKPNSVLRTLTPLFPVQAQQQCTNYWADDIAVVDDKSNSTRVIIVNSCAFHGLSTSLTVEEYRHGRVTRDSLRKLRNIVRSTQHKKNILLVHHHLRPHPEIGADISVAVDGALLLDLLATSNKQWLVIHGHEHLSYLGYEGATTCPPIILSAGSVASTELRHVSRRLTTNQMYYIDLPNDVNNGTDPALYGEVRAWDWFPLTGWQPAHKDAGIRYYCGFGSRGNLASIADEIEGMVISTTAGFLPWRDAWTTARSLKFLIPSDQDNLFALLSQRKIRVAFGSEGAPFGFAREI